MNNLVSVRYLITSVMTFLFASALSAQTVAEADSAYAKGDYADAVRIYHDVIHSQGESSELLYNLGNAYSKGGDYGHAMASYLRSLRFDPSNSQAKENIKYIESKVLETNKGELKGRKYSLDAESSTFFETVRYFIARDHSSDTWAIWGAVCFILFVVSVAAYTFVSQVVVRKIGFFGGFVFLGLSIVAVAFSFMAASYKSDEGVITAPKVKLRSEASVSSKEGPVNLTRGTRMVILDTFPAGADNPKWFKVRLNSDFIGWISASDFAAVEP